MVPVGSRHSFTRFKLTVNDSFITPIFLHAGIIHILLNMLAQLTLTAQVRDSYSSFYTLSCIFFSDRERNGFGWLFLTYFAAGIFGCVLTANRVVSLFMPAAAMF